MERLVVRASLVLLVVAACLGDPNVPPLGSDDFDRTVANNSTSWGNADVGGPWSVDNPNASTVSVGSGHGNVTLATTLAAASFHLPTAMARDTETRVIVSFDPLPTTGNYTAYVNVRLVQETGSYYWLQVTVSPGGSIDATIQAVVGLTGTPIGAATPPITVSAGSGLELSLVATGTSPTTLCGKVWLEGTVEPSACTVPGQDNTAALQVPGLSFLTAIDNGGELPTVSFSTFRYLQVGPE
jgi:hypothetical protein